MGFRRRTRRRALIAGAVAGGAIAHHEARKAGESQRADDQAPAGDYQGQDQGQGQGQDQDQYAPPPADPADEIEHLAQLHASGALSDEEFTTAKANILGT
jgi:Short C-terminal domain